MNPEDRIAALEREVAGLRAAFAEYVRMHQELGGHDRMYQSAVLALIASHSDPASLEPTLAQHLASTDANIVGTSNTEEHLQGAQEAQALLNSALSEAKERRKPAAPDQP